MSAPIKPASGTTVLAKTASSLPLVATAPTRTWSSNISPSDSASIRNAFCYATRLSTSWADIVQDSSHKMSSLFRRNLPVRFKTVSEADSAITAKSWGVDYTINVTAFVFATAVTIFTNMDPTTFSLSISPSALGIGLLTYIGARYAIPIFYNLGDSIKMHKHATNLKESEASCQKNPALIKEYLQRELATEPETLRHLLKVINSKLKEQFKATEAKLASIARELDSLDSGAGTESSISDNEIAKKIAEIKSAKNDWQRLRATGKNLIETGKKEIEARAKDLQRSQLAALAEKIDTTTVSVRSPATIKELPPKHALAIIPNDDSDSGGEIAVVSDTTSATEADEFFEALAQIISAQF